MSRARAWLWRALWRACATWVLATVALCVQAQGAAKQAPSGPRDEAIARAKGCFEKGRIAYAAGHLGDARAAFTCAYEASPSPELAWNLARVYDRMGDASQGIRFYALYLESDAVKPADRAEIQRRIEALEALRERQRAQVKATSPSQTELGAEARAFFDRGVKLYKRGRYDAALAAFTAALRASGAPELHYNLAVTSERLHKPSDALDHFRAYLASRPDADDRADVEARITQLRKQMP